MSAAAPAVPPAAATVAEVLTQALAHLQRARTVAGSAPRDSELYCAEDHVRVALDLVLRQIGGGQ
jgi:hypothetical protein